MDPSLYLDAQQRLMGSETHPPPLGGNQLSSFCVILPTSQQTNAHGVKTGTSLAEVEDLSVCQNVRKCCKNVDE